MTIDTQIALLAEKFGQDIGVVELTLDSINSKVSREPDDRDLAISSATRSIQNELDLLGSLLFENPETLEQAKARLAELQDLADIIGSIGIDQIAELPGKLNESLAVAPIYAIPGVSGQGHPNLDVAAKTFTFYSDTVLKTPTEYFVITTNRVIDFSAVVSTAVQIYYSFVVNQFIARPYNSLLTKQEREEYKYHQLAFIRTSTAKDAPYVSMLGAHTINGVPFGISNLEAPIYIVPGLAVDGPPNINTTNKTLTFPSDTLFKTRRNTYVAAGSKVIDLNVGSTAIHVYFSFKTSQFIAKGFYSELSDLEVKDGYRLLAFVRLYGAGLPGTHVSINGSYTIDGNLYGLSDYKDIAAIKTASVLNTKAATNANQIFIIPGLSNQGVPNLNTVNKTLEFFGDTILRTPTKSKAFSANRSVSLIVGVATAVQVFYSFSTDALIVKEWGVALTAGELADDYQSLAFIRLKEIGAAGSNMSIIGPYTIDGAPFGLTSIQTSPSVYLIPGLANQGVPNLNTVTKRLYFYPDTILRTSKDYRMISTERSVDLNAVGSSAAQIYYSFKLDLFLAIKYDQYLTHQQTVDLYRLVAFVRMLPNGTAGTHITMLGPYSINGALYGLTGLPTTGDIGEVIQDVAALDTAVTNLGTDVAALEAGVSNLGIDVAAVETGLSNLGTSVAVSVDDFEDRITLNKRLVNVAPSVMFMTGLNNLGVPNLNTQDKTFTIYADSIFRHHSSARVFPSTVVIDIDIGTSAIQIYYSFIQNIFIVRSYATPLTETEITQEYRLFALIRMLPFGTPGTNVTIIGPYSINGERYGMPTATDARVALLSDSVEGVAHRGWSTVAPENTLPAYRLAQQNGFTYVECDVGWTSDNVPVLLHDTTIDRTSDGTGALSEMTYAQVSAFDYGSWKGAEYTGTPIPTLAEFLLTCKLLKLHPFIELKTFLTVDQAAIAKQTLSRAGMLGRVSWISFSKAAIESILVSMPNSRVSFLTTDLASLSTLRSPTNEVFATLNSGDIATYANAFLDEGYEINAWTINDVPGAEAALQAGVTYISTDSLDVPAIALSLAG